MIMVQAPWGSTLGIRCDGGGSSGGHLSWVSCSATWSFRPAGVMRDNVRVSDVPKNPMTRAAKMARLPIGLAGRTALGVGKRIGGRPAEIVAQEIQQRTAEQIFRVLGELKGGAMKLGQALSIFEAALPPEIAGPYRATLT